MASDKTAQGFVQLDLEKEGYCTITLYNLPHFQTVLMGKNLSLKSSLELSSSMCGHLCLILPSCTTMRNPDLSPWWPLEGTEGLWGAPKVISSPGWSSPAPPTSVHILSTLVPTGLKPSKAPSSFPMCFLHCRAQTSMACLDWWVPQGEGWPFSLGQCAMPLFTHTGAVGCLSCWPHQVLMVGLLPPTSQTLPHRAASQDFNLFWRKA